MLEQFVFYIDPHNNQKINPDGLNTYKFLNFLKKI